MYEFNWIFNGEDMLTSGVVDVFHHRCECRRFAGPGWAGYRDKPTRRFRNFTKYLAHTELVYRNHLGRDGPKDAAGAPIMVKSIHSKSGDS